MKIFTSIRNQLIVCHLVLVVMLIVIGCTIAKTSNELGLLATGLYDKNYTGMDNAREALLGFGRFEAKHPDAHSIPLDANARAEVKGLLGYLDITIERATTARTRELATETRAKLLALSEASGNRPELSEIDDALSQVVKQFASDQIAYRLQTEELIEYSYHQWLISIAAVVGFASLILLSIGRSILSPLDRAAAIAAAIAQGNLDNRIITTGPREASQLLLALSKVQKSILDNIKRETGDKLELTTANSQLHFTLLELKKQEKELQEYKHTLEKMVSDRTDELGKNNERLISEIARRQRTEQDLVKAKEVADAANRAKSRFLASMSHEIRTPMNGVIGMVDLLRQTELSPRQAHFTRIIQQSARALLTIINDILDFSKIEAGELTLDIGSVDLRVCADDVANLLAAAAQKKGIELTCTISNNVPPLVKGDRARIRQVLVNLVGNAIKFTEQGDVAIQVDSFALGMNGGLVRVRLEVRDTGIGIAKEAIAGIFDAFRQVDDATNRKFEGTGLGLSIVRQLVTLMGGKIEVESDVGRGSLFRVEFTFAVLKPPVMATLRSSTSFPGKRALIVDDSAASRKVIEHYLRNLRIASTSVASADAAVGELESQRPGNPYDLAIIDAVMPGMSGIDLARRLRADAATASLPLVMLTSLEQAVVTAVDAAAGNFPSLTKPVRESDFRKQIADVLSPRPLARVEFPSTTEGDAVGEIAAARPALNLRVLLAEDSPINQEIARENLTSFGCHVDVAGNGREALAAFDSNDYDVIVMDCQMPEMDGFEATRQIRKRQARNEPSGRVPIIALTAYASIKDRERCLAAGMDDCLTKPFETENLYRLIDRWTQQSPRIAGPARPPQIAALKSAGPEVALDAKVMGSLRRVSGAKGQSLLEKMGRLYLESMPKALADLESAIERPAPYTVNSIAHRLKSVAGNIGAKELATLFNDLEEKASTLQPGEANAALRKIKIEFERTAIALQLEMTPRVTENA